MPPRPCGRLGGLSWGCAVLQGHKRACLGWSWVPPGPYDVFTPFGHSTGTPSHGRSRGRPFLDFRSPAELDQRDPAPSRRLRGMADDASSPGLSVPYDTCRAGGCVPMADPSVTARHVRGLATPFATSTTGPADATSAPERPWASPFKDFPSLRSVPLSGSLPSCRCRPPRNLPGGQRMGRDRLQGLAPATSPC